MHEIGSRRLMYKEWLKFDQTIRNITPGDLEILLVVIRPVLCILQTCLREKRRRDSVI